MNKFFFKLILAGFLVMIMACFGIVFLNFLNFSLAATSADAIAVRVIPNSDNYSPTYWYEKNIKVKGSPQSLLVDGYQAVRDGRTVYINAANIQGSTFYTNIYIISYNQQAETATTDIFGQILAHWQFNSNLPTAGNCSLTTSTSCLVDAACPAGEYCTSEKAEVTRDTRRLSDLATIKIALENYRSKNGYYPRLTSGSYLPNKTVSVWPSWQETLASQLTLNLPVDPINQLGDCPGYDPVTCWNQETKQFADPTPADGNFNLPTGSRAYVYTVAANGSSYGTCGSMESGYFTTSPSSPCPQSISYLTGTTTNHPPMIIIPPASVIENNIIVITLVSGQTLRYYIEADDQDNDNLSNLSLWTINVGNPADWTNANWSAAPILRNSAVPQIKLVYSATAGSAGDYYFSVTVSDGQGGTDQKNFKVRVTNHPPIVTLHCQTSVRVNHPYPTCAASASDPDGHSITGFGFSGLPTGISGDTISGVISGTPTQRGNYTITISATDQYTAVGYSSFTLNVNTYCTDGLLEAQNMEGVSEACDDGNTIATDACNNNCQWTCRALSSVDFTTGIGDSVVYDDNNNPNSAVDQNDGYLKISGFMPTPYIWIANSDVDRVSKIRTFDGWRRDCQRSTSGAVNCNWNYSAWESRGQLINVFAVGDNPSRTAVNAETGDVWVANRDSGNVTKLDIYGVHLKTCDTGSGPRGVAIEENGDAWVANSNDGTVVKISGNDTSCSILQTVNVAGYPYGLAIDSNNNIWVANRGNGMIQKIDTSNYILTSYSTAASAPYGITVDLADNIWVADTSVGVYKLIQSTGVVDHNTFTGLANSYGQSRGVTIDIAGSIWIAMDYSNQVVKIPDPANPSSYEIFNISGAFPIGIVGDSAGQVWVINYSSSNATVFNLSGTIVGTYNVSTIPVLPYTYSDMTGLNRAALLRTGKWNEIFDSGNNNQHWGTINFQSVIPSASQSLIINLRADDDLVVLDTKSWLSSGQWNVSFGNRVGRFLQINMILKSRKRGVTPVIWQSTLTCP